MKRPAFLFLLGFCCVLLLMTLAAIDDAVTSFHLQRAVLPLHAGSHFSTAAGRPAIAGTLARGFQSNPQDMLSQGQAEILMRSNPTEVKAAVGLSSGHAIIFVSFAATLIVAFSSLLQRFSAQKATSWAMQAEGGERTLEIQAEANDRGSQDEAERQYGFGRDLSESSRERQSLFNGIAPVYDLLNDALSLGQHRLWKLQTVAWTEAAFGDHVLDICCGSGDLAMLLALKVGYQGKVSAVDFAADMLQKGRDRVASPFNTPIRVVSAPIDWIQGDALALPFPDATFQGATMGYGLRNVVSIPAALSEIRRVLRPGAKAAILDFHRPSNGAVAAFQKLYLDNLVVPAATVAGLEKEYEYIMPSLEAFPTGPEQESLALAAGFRSAKHHEIAAGLMGCLVVQK